MLGMLTFTALKAHADRVGFRESGSDWEMKCPRCAHHRARFYANPDTLQHYCFHCHLGRKGDTWDGGASPLAGPETLSIKTPLTQEFLSQCQRALWDTKEGRRVALHYMTQVRGWSPEQIRLEGMGFDPDKHAIVFPSFWHGRLVTLKYRSLVPDTDTRWFRVQGGDTVLSTRVGSGHPKRTTKACFILEGEPDRLTLEHVANQYDIYGFPGKDCKHADFVDEFDDYPQIFICFDNEVKAQKSAEELASLLGDFRCWAVELPKEYKDINEWWVARKDTDFRKQWTLALQNAKPFGRPLVLPTQDYKAKALEHYERHAGVLVSTGYPPLDKITGGMAPGRVFGLCAPVKTGKSTLALDIMVNLARAGHKCLVGSFEMKVAEEMLPKIGSKLLSRNIELAEFKLPKDRYDKLLTWIDTELPIHWINRHDKIKLRELYSAVKLKYAEGFRFLLLDHLQFIMDFGYDEVFKATAKVSRLIKRLTNDFPELTILAIIQMAGFEPSGNSNYKQDTRRTMGGNQIPSDIDQLWWFGPPHAKEGCIVVRAARNTTVKAGGQVRVIWHEREARYEILPA